MPTVQLLRVFISSPGDVAEERDLCERVIGTLNFIYDKMGNDIRLDALTSERNTYTTAAPTYVQAELSRQIGEYHIYLGIMGERYGTLTPAGMSGTEEEFYSAYTKFNRDPRSIRILFYFKQVNTARVHDADEFAKVQAFKERLKAYENIYYKPYASLELFTIGLFAHLAAHVIDFGKLWGPMKDDTITDQPDVKPTDDVRRLPSDEKYGEDLARDPDAILDQLTISNLVLADVLGRLNVSTPEYDAKVDAFLAEIKILRKERDRFIVGGQFSADTIRYVRGLDAEVEIVADAIHGGCKALAFSVPYLELFGVSAVETLSNTLQTIIDVRPKLAELLRKVNEARRGIPRWPVYIKQAKPEAEIILQNVERKTTEIVGFIEGAVIALEPLVTRLQLQDGD